MRHFEMRFDSQERLQVDLAANPTADDDGDDHELTDPSGIKLRLAKAPNRGGSPPLINGRKK
jgi:hypothetical protein